jgi:uncharacterized protein
LRRAEKEIASQQEILEVIQKAVVCHLAFMDGDEPYIVPMNFGYQDNSIYLHSAAEGRKIDLLKKNKKVGFELEIDVETVAGSIPCNWSMKYRSITGWGKAEILEGNKAKILGLNIIASHYTLGKLDFPEENLDKITVIRVGIEKLSGKKSKI